MSIAPLAALGIAKTAFDIIGALADAVKRPQTTSVQSMEPKAQESIWHQIGQEVDVRSLTRDELAKVSQLLYDNGAISLQDHATMSFDPSFAGSTNLLTTPDSAGQVDWVAEFQARLRQHTTAGDTEAAAGDQRILEIFARLQAGSKGVTSIRV
jgi:hypothetical protein